jgi:hypothetical protein
MKINNVNLAKIQETKEKLEKGIWPAHRIFEVSGEWVFDKVQFITWSTITVPPSSYPTKYTHSGGTGMLPIPYNTSFLG